MTTVLVTGATGLLGHALCGYLATRQFSLLRQSRDSATDFCGDLRDREFVGRMVEKSSPNVIVNLVALTNVDYCEQHPKEAFEGNVTTAANLVAFVTEHPDVRMIQISTDQVYDGPGPHGEADVAPCNLYAYSKYCAEQVALSAGATVLRTNFFGPGTQSQKSFSDWLIERFSKKAPLQLVTDVLFSPLHLHTLVRMIERAILAPATGVFNLGSHNGLSKRNFAHALARHLELNTDAAKDATSAELGLAARRPGDMRMIVTRFEDAFNTLLPELSNEITLLERPA